MEACGKVHATAVLPAGRYSSTHSVPTELEGLWASERFIALWRKENFLVPARIQTPESPVRRLGTVPITEQLICTLERILFMMVNLRRMKLSEPVARM